MMGWSSWMSNVGITMLVSVLRTLVLPSMLLILFRRYLPSYFGRISDAIKAKNVFVLQKSINSPISHQFPLALTCNYSILFSRIVDRQSNMGTVLFFYRRDIFAHLLIEIKVFSQKHMEKTAIKKHAYNLQELKT
jgi:hypothetical protein